MLQKPRLRAPVAAMVAFSMIVAGWFLGSLGTRATGGPPPAQKIQVDLGGNESRLVASEAPLEATFNGPITPGDQASFLLGGASPQLKAEGYRQTEWFASGEAQSYSATAPEGNDGRWKVAAAGSSPYTTRIVVRTPTEASKFNGTVVVEWLNVSGGSDLPADGIYLSPELEQAGYAWVGVSAQQLGVNKLRTSDPARYSSLTQPGDQYSFSIFSQVARALRATSGKDPLGSLHPKRLIAVGESQSAIYLTTYVDAIQPVSDAFNGFLIHSRAGGAIPIAGGSMNGSLFSGGVRIRTDIGVPVLVLATETDEAFGHYYDARQPDSRYFRLWDIAGASHADAYLFGSAGAKALGCTSYNDAPSHFIIAASLNALNKWMKTSTPPVSASRLDVKVVNGAPTVEHDRLGVAIGGIQGPWIKTPIAAYSGTPAPGSPGGCALFGSAQPFPSAQLARIYKSKAAYLKAYTLAADQAIKSGYILSRDRAAVLTYADQAQV